jgi:hypothetical protein
MKLEAAETKENHEKQDSSTCQHTDAYIGTTQEKEI